MGRCVGGEALVPVISLCLYVVSTSGRGTYRPPCHAGRRMRG